MNFKDIPQLLKQFKRVSAIQIKFNSGIDLKTISQISTNKTEEDSTIRNALNRARYGRH